MTEPAHQVIDVANGAVRLTTPDIITDELGGNITPDNITISLGTDKVAGTWAAPDVVTHPTPSSIAVQRLVDSTVAAGEYWTWLKLIDGAETVVLPGHRVTVRDSTTEVDDIRERATYVIWALSGRVYGTETITARPMQPAETSYRTNVPNSYDGRDGYELAAVGALLGHGCTPTIKLSGPVQSVQQVVCDGVILDSSAWRLNGSDLIRTDGSGWPLGQSLAQPITAPGTLQITYTRGRPWPPAAMSAIDELAGEIRKAVDCDDTCRLPERVSAVTREGVSISMIQPADYLTDGYTGLAAVDQWIAAVNPAHIAAPPDVWSPDLIRENRQ